jgi:peroxiredoxin
MPSMTELLAQNSARGEEKRPPETTAAMRAATAKLATSGIKDRTLKEGEKIPDFSLPNALGKPVSSTDVLADGPAVLNFYRGGWCSYCNIEMRALQERLPEIEALGATLVAIAPELPTKAEATKAKNELTYEVLSDVGNDLSKKFGLVFTLAEEVREIYQTMGIDVPDYNGDDSFDLPIPATYVVGTDGIVVKAFADPDYSKRLDVEDILEALKNA